MLCYYVDYNSLYIYIITPTPGQGKNLSKPVSERSTTNHHMLRELAKKKSRGLANSDI